MKNFNLTDKLHALMHEHHARKMQACEKNIKAFSLAEMMIVMLLLSVMMAAAAPIISMRAKKQAESKSSTSNEYKCNDFGKKIVFTNKGVLYPNGTTEQVSQTVTLNGILIDLCDGYKKASNSYFYVPAGVTKVYVTMIGGGGGGAGAGDKAGAAGTYIEKQAVSVTPGQSIAVTVGAGGSGGYCGKSTSGDYWACSAGGKSSFGSYVSAAGGACGTINNTKENYQEGSTWPNVGYDGQASVFGAGGTGNNIFWSNVKTCNAKSPAATAYGAGGGGAHYCYGSETFGYTESFTSMSAAGAAGVVIVEW